MDAGGLQQGFRLEEWRVEPGAARIISGDLARVLPPQQLRLLLRLAETHGETVSREDLREAGWPGEQATDPMLQQALRELQDTLGDTQDDPRFIVAVAKRGYALVGHFDSLANTTDSRDAAQKAASRKPTILGRLIALIGEMRRRSVFKVAAAYLFGMWIVLQVAEVTFEPLQLPDWWMTALTILAVVGLPIVLALAWSYEITDSGIMLDPGSGPAVRLPRARRALAPAMVAGVALMAAVTGVAWWRTIGSPTDEPQRAPASGPPSLAVLPLTDMSPAGGSEYLGDGLSEELSARLAQIPGLRVASRTSAFEFKDQNIDVRKIGEALGVQHLLEGSVRRDGDAVRVTVQLIDAETGFHIWTGTYDREWRKLLLVQQEIAEAVAAALQVVLTPSGDAGAGSTATAAEIDPRALDPYLAGLALLRQPGDPGAMREAARRFTDAIELAPAFAGAHAGLCRARLRQFAQLRDPALLSAGELSCRRAIEIDPSLVDTRKALAQLRVSSGDYAEAEDRYRELLERYPLDADIHIGLADALAGRGKQDLAELGYRRAAEVEPAYWAAHSALGSFLFQHGRIEEAEASFEDVTALVPASALAWSNLGATRQMLGDFSGALAAYQTSLLLEPSVLAHSNLATTHFYLGQFDQAVHEFEQAIALGSHDQSIWGNLGDALWQVQGRRDDAVAAYRRAIELAEAERAQVHADPTLLAQLGYYWGRVGDLERSIGHLDRALATGADHVYVQYFRAVAATDRGDVDEALEALGRLIELGYPVALLRAGPEFGSLVADERFKAVVDRADRA
jgi:TolB-like protein/tetratricopeptide (TPR) repeat protein/DNA-binding winged helix-turn-helix (wHTH) protein